MTDELHTLGFKVILWIAPFVSDQAADFQKLKDENLLVLDKNGRPAKRKWWNGADYLLDFSNPAAQDWFFACTRYLTDKLGIDGFKQDAGDAMYYRDDDRTYGGVDANGQSKLWALSARHYRFNELRACFNAAAWALPSDWRIKATVGTSWDWAHCYQMCSFKGCPAILTAARI